MRLREVREGLGVTQVELHERSGVSRTTISSIENGKRGNASTVRKLAKALGVPVTEITGYGQSRDTLFDLSAHVRSFGLEPEPHYAELAFPSEGVARIFESAYVRILQAEKRASEGRWDEPLPDLDHVVRLKEAVDALQQGEGRTPLRERVSAMLRRAADAYAQEADRLESKKAQIIDLAASKRRNEGRAQEEAKSA